MGDISFHVNSFFNSISYRIGDLLVDPGDKWIGFDKVEAVLLTHAHFDHIYGLNQVVAMNPNVVVITNAAGREMLLSDRKNMSRFHETPFVFEHEDRIRIIEEDRICMGHRMVSIIPTPGHNPSCLTFMIDQMIFSGDSYIPGIKTVTNLPGGNRAQAEESIRKILSLGGTVYPGHYIDSIKES